MKSIVIVTIAPGKDYTQPLRRGPLEQQWIRDQAVDVMAATAIDLVDNT